MSNPTLVQYNDGIVSSGLPFLSNVTKGNFLLCIVQGFSNSVVGDSLGNYWVELESDFGSDTSAFYCPASIASGANTVDLSNANSGFVAIAEFTPSLIQSYTALASASLTSASLTGAANQLLVGYAYGTAASAITGAGIGFTYESVNEAGRIAMEYQALSGAGSVSSVFTGTAAHVVTGALILSELVTPLAETPSLVQVQGTTFGSSFPNSVTAGNTLIVPIFSQVGPIAPFTDALGNSFQVLVSGTVSIGGSGTGRLSLLYCTNCKGGLNAANGNFALEFTPSVIATFSNVATGTPSGGMFGSTSISANAAQLLVGYNVLWGGIPATAVPGYQGISTWLNGGITAEIQPVTSNDNFASAFTYDPAFGGSNYMTGVLALQSAYAISGNVSGVVDYAATVSFAGPTSGTVDVDRTTGNYTIPGLVSGTYTITPVLGSFVFTPTNSVQTVDGANITGVNFATYSISGSLGTPFFTFVQIAYSGPTSGVVNAHSDGTYTIPGLGPGAYTITSSSVGYAFSPTSHSETITSANLTGVNFTATRVVTASSRFTFVQRPSTAPGATLHDCVDSGNGKLVGQLFFDPIVRQAWSLNLRDNTPNISAGGSDALDIQNFAAALAEPPGVTIIQPSNTPSTRFKFTPVVRRSGESALLYLVSDGPSIAFGSIGQVIWDGTSGTNGAWTFLQTNAESEISSPADVACITSFVASLELISPNQISL